MKQIYLVIDALLTLFFAKQVVHVKKGATKKLANGSIVAGPVDIYRVGFSQLQPVYRLASIDEMQDDFEQQVW